MQFSESWLRRLVNPSLDSAALQHLLTMAGLEVEEARPVAPPFDKVVVARVLTTEKHPDADKLKLCRVDAGQGEPLQIVCGAPNVAPDMLVPCALVGARLPGIEIRKAKVRGVESFGMLCSAKELGIAEDASGVMALPADAPVGHSVREVLDLDDTLLTLKLTPNRADCLSLAGIAREVAALTGADLKLPEISAIASTHDAQREVRLDAADACPRYCGRVIRGIDAKAPTPAWMKQRLERSGIRSISAVVDVTNYVMLELGQPMHAFDNATLQGAISVRHPKPGETLTLLNGQTVIPDASTALIADQQRALALAGIMGGDASGVGDATREIFLESAFFAPGAIMGKARELGFSTDSSHRFERGVDFELQRPAIERATQLILEICGGQPGPVTEVVAALPQRKPVTLRTTRVAKVLGVDLSADTIAQQFARLGFPTQRSGEDFVVKPPSRRFDIEIEEDLIEEVARLYGYDNIPSRPPHGLVSMLPLPEARRTPMQLRRSLAARGFQEVVNFSFVDAEWEKDFGTTDAPIALANPIASQMGVMRTTLVGGLVDTLINNRKRKLERVRIFEIGRCFLKNAAAGEVPGFDQPVRLGLLIAGTAAPEQWGIETRPVDYFDLKGEIETLYGVKGLRFEKQSHPALHPGRAAGIRLDNRLVGVIGELHPRWVQKYELGRPPVVAELDLPPLLEHLLPTYREVSRFPAVVRDLALIVDHGVSWQSLSDTLRAAAPKIVTAIDLFDMYQGKGIAEGRKSLAFRIVMQDTERTLADAEVEVAVVELLSAAEKKFNAELRR